jgi:hypothetical protein
MFRMHLLIFCCLLSNVIYSQNGDVNIVDVAPGWANNSVNTVIFRKNSLVTFRDTQFIAFYDAQRFVVLGKRKLGSKDWQLKKTGFQGNAVDAHNMISIMVDGQGYLHMSWDHHNNALRYCRSMFPGSIDMLEKLSLTGKLENKVSYPEFYKLPNGDLLFFYRDGGSGQGNLVINKYHTATQQWTQLHSNLIDGERKRNAYWQACIDSKGTIHISWVWRESPDVASNHEMGYARSSDGGITWERSNDKKYTLPITAATAEYALRIPEKSELINQTSMNTDDAGNPFIASYWREPNSQIPQYHIVHFTRKKWHSLALNFRKTPFSLSGAGSKRIPIARPQLIVKGSGKRASALLIFRDEERGNKVSVATVKKIKKGRWKVDDLNETTVGSWEPTFDTELWKEKGLLNIFVQKVEQLDAEGTANMPPQMVQVLEWKPRY